MNLSEAMESLKEHKKRFSSASGAAGEKKVISSSSEIVKRPDGKKWKILDAKLQQKGIQIKSTSFDCMLIPENCDESDLYDINKMDIMDDVVFIEVKSTKNERVGEGFKKYYFAITENEMSAANQLGSQYRFLFKNLLTGEMLDLSIGDILERSTSRTWACSIQL